MGLEDTEPGMWKFMDEREQRNLAAENKQLREALDELLHAVTQIDTSAASMRAKGRLGEAEAKACAALALGPWGKS